MAALDKSRRKTGTDNYYVVGNPVSHSKSPQIHRLFAEQCQQDIHYQALQVELGGFADAVSALQKAGARGLNVTLPFKTDAADWVGRRTPRAEKAVAVNTIWFDEAGCSHGDNTDGAGLVDDLRANNIDLQDQSVLILGAGGAARGVIGPLAEAGVKKLVIANRTLARAEQLMAMFGDTLEIEVSAYESLQPAIASLIINASSAGLDNHVPPLDPGVAAGACCYDMLYGDGDTAFLSWAKHNGAGLCLDGLGMLVRQAAESFYIWRGTRPDAGTVLEMIRQGN